MTYTSEPVVLRTIAGVDCRFKRDPESVCGRPVCQVLVMVIIDAVVSMIHKIESVSLAERVVGRLINRALIGLDAKPIVIVTANDIKVAIIVGVFVATVFCSFRSKGLRNIGR